MVVSLVPDSAHYGILHDLGFDPLLLTAGFLGGLLRAFLAREIRPLSLVTSIVAGFICGNYLGSTLALALKNLVADGAALGLGGLVAGFAGMELMERINRLIGKAIDKRFNGNGSKGNGASAH